MRQNLRLSGKKSPQLSVRRRSLAVTRSHPPYRRRGCIRSRSTITGPVEAPEKSLPADFSGRRRRSGVKPHNRQLRGPCPCLGDTGVPCRDDANISIYECLKYENIPHLGSCARYRCQFPVERILAQQIPLPAISRISRQGPVFVFIFALLGHLLDAETDFFPELREFEAVNRAQNP